MQQLRKPAKTSRTDGKASAKMDIVATTPRVLRQCASVISTPNHEKYVDTPDHTKYATNPDIQYFRSVKAKNHYLYHRLKRSSKPLRDRIYAAASTFDPYSRSQLLQRLATYTVLNWALPEGASNDKTWAVTELKCARNGWRCTSVAQGLLSGQKNHLVCDICHRQLVLRYNKAHDSIYNFDAADVAKLNASVARVHLDQITAHSHGPACPWQSLETPLEGVYYMRPHLQSTNATLLDEYRHTLNSLVRHWRVLEPQLAEKVLSAGPLDETFVSASNAMLLQDNSDKENLTTLVASAPWWIYTVAQLGWEIRSQKFSTRTVHVLLCTGCNSRLILKHRRLLPEQLGPLDLEDCDEFDPWEHKWWCCRLRDSENLLEMLRQGTKRTRETEEERKKQKREEIEK